MKWLVLILVVSAVAIVTDFVLVPLFRVAESQPATAEAEVARTVRDMETGKLLSGEEPVGWPKRAPLPPCPEDPEFDARIKKYNALRSQEKSGG